MVAVSNNKSQAAAEPTFSGKNLSYYKKRSKQLPSKSSDEDEDSNDDEEDEDDSAASDATVDSLPTLKKSNKFEKSDLDDEEEEEEEEEEDEDESGSSTDEEKPKLKTPIRKQLKIPKRLDMASIRKQRESTAPSEIDENENAIESDSSIDTPVKPSARDRRTSVIDNDFDDRLAFPRSDGAAGNGQAQDSGNIDYDEDENAELLDMLNNGDNAEGEYDEGDEYDEEEDDDEDDDDDDDDDDSGEYDYADLEVDYDDDELVEEHEEQAIMDEMKDTELYSNASSPGPLYEDEFGFYADEDDEEDEDETIYFDDFLEPANDSTPKTINSEKLNDENDDDSYLWSYFFSSADEYEADDDNNANNAHHHASSTGEPQDEDGEETDEDLSVPRPSKQQKTARATEVLSSSNTGSRPPTLGVWVMNNERPCGIIDGLTTRTLSPPPHHRQPHLSQQQQRANHKKRGWSQAHNSDSEVSEIALDEFIYTSDLDDDHDNDEQAVVDSPFASKNGLNTTPVPLSAFRNRGVMTAPSHYHASARRLSNSTSSKRHREAVITPVKTMQKRLKKRRRSHSHRRRLHHDPNVSNDLHDDPNEGEHWNELLEMGALSPLFAGIS